MAAAYSLIVALCVLCAVPAAAHPFHASFAEVGMAADHGRLEVALRIIPEDLEQALSQQAGRALSLNDSPDTRAALGSYLAQHFRVVQAQPAGGGVEVLGMDVAYDATWIYFTVPVNPQSPAQLENTLLFDLDAGQANRVQLLWAPEAPVLVFTARELRRPLWVNGSAINVPEN